MLRGFRGLIVLSAVLTLISTNVQAAPLGLSPGDKIDSITFLADADDPPNGADYTVSNEIMHGEGLLQSVILADGGGSIAQSGVTFTFDLKLFSEVGSLTGPGNAFLNTVVNLVSPGGLVTGPDVVITEGGTNILFGDFGGLLTSSGSINLLQAGGGQFTIQGIINILGGDSNLTDSLGGAGTSQALISITASLTEFVPALNVLGADGEVYNSDFTVSVSGTLTPLNASAFVPEPSTAVLLGAGLLGVLGVSRRKQRKE